MVSTARNKHRPTLADVADRAGVSAQTVSRAIRSPEQLSADTLHRVQYAIEQTGYVRNLAASHLASARTMSVGVVLPSLSSSIFADAISGLDQELTAAGYQMFLGVSGYDLAGEETVVRAALERQPDGLFLVGTRHSAGTCELLRRSSTPVVETWDLSRDPIGHVVGFSNEQAMADLTRQLLRQGYRRPVFAGPANPDNERTTERRAGFTRTVTELLGADAVRLLETGSEFTELDNGRHLIDSVRAQFPDTDLVLAASDITAVGAMFECARRGISVPDDLAIAGFGNFDLARNVLPRLTTVEVPNRQIGVRGGQVLVQAMRDPELARRTIDLGYSIVIGDST